jgi:hypothetical protein
MTRVLRETDRYQLIMEVFNQYTTILERKTGKMSNWNTGSDAIKESKYLIVVEAGEFDEYCAAVDKD